MAGAGPTKAVARDTAGRLSKAGEVGSELTPGKEAGNRKPGDEQGRPIRVVSKWKQSDCIVNRGLSG